MTRHVSLGVLALAIVLSASAACWAVCGDGVVDPGEQCDDNNVIDGDCCSSSCQYEADGQTCPDEGSLCTTDSCDGAGACVHEAVPQPVCFGPFVPDKGRIVLSTKRMSWRMIQGDDSPNGAYGNPQTTTSYAFCVYDGSASPQPLFAADVPAAAQCNDGRPCWKTVITLGPQVELFVDPQGRFDDITKIRLADSNTPDFMPTNDIIVRARSTTSALPPPPFTPPVTVQLRNSLGFCWGATFSTPQVNDTRKFRASPD